MYLSNLTRMYMYHIHTCLIYYAADLRTPSQILKGVQTKQNNHHSTNGCMMVSLHTKIVWLSNIKAVIIEHVLEQQCSVSSEHIPTEETLAREC